MKKIKMCAVLLSTVFLSQFAAASDTKLKRGCLKDHPVMVGVSDPSLLGIYTEICDKKNKDNVNALLVPAAQRFQQLGLDFQALQIIANLEAQNVESHTLTDVKFLIGAKFAQESLQHMRNQQSRFLNTDSTYPAAKSLAEEIQKTLPSSVLQELAPSPTPVRSYQPPRTQTKPRPRPAVRPVPATRPAAAPVVKPTPAAKPPAKPAQSPFSNL